MNNRKKYINVAKQTVIINSFVIYNIHGAAF